MTDGGWTYLQRRFDGSVAFGDRTHQDYVDGFGTVNGEFWLGLDKMRLFSSSAVSVQLDLTVDTGACLTAQYSSFSIGAPSSYILSVSGYVDGGGLCAQTLVYNNGKAFAARNGPNSNSCPATRYQGWWFGSCTYLSINGDYSRYPDNERGFTEHACGGYNNLVGSIMKVQ